MKEIPKPNIVTVLEHLGGTVVGGDRGGWRKASCPIHDDRNPSASVNEDECRFTCFTCSFSGDAIDLIMEATSVGFADARRVAEGLLGEGDGGVRAGRGRTGSVPGRSGNHSGGRSLRAPWSSL